MSGRPAGGAAHAGDVPGAESRESHRRMQAFGEKKEQVLRSVEEIRKLQMELFRSHIDLELQCGPRASDARAPPA